MMRRAAVWVMVAAGGAAAQSATVTLVPADPQVPAGSSTTVSVMLTFTTAGNPGGAFGDAGLFGFGGVIDAPSAPAGTSGGSVSVSPLLPFGPSGSAGAGPLARAAGGRESSAITGGPVELFTFELGVPASAAPGAFSIAFSGEVVLSLDDELKIFNSVPTPRRLFLASLPTTITVTPGCACDLDGSGLLNVDDIDAFASAFLSGSLDADLDGSGALNVDDVDAFAACFLAGCD